MSLEIRLSTPFLVRAFGDLKRVMKTPYSKTRSALGIAWAVAAMASIGSPIAANAAGSEVECLIEPTKIVEVATSASGQVVKTMVARGDQVKRGQVLAQLDGRQERAELAAAKFRSTQQGPAELAAKKVKFARLKFERMRELAKDKLVAAQESDDAETELRLAEAELQVAQENKALADLEVKMQQARLSLLTIHSPINGVVVKQAVFEGELIGGGGSQASVYTLAQIDPLRIHMILPKDEFGKLKLGDSVAVQTEAPLSRKLEAKVKSVDRLIDAASGTFVVVLEVANPKLDIPAGLRCTAKL